MSAALAALGDERVLIDREPPVIAASGLTRRYGAGRHRGRRTPRRLARDPARRADGRHGPVGLGQVDADAHPRRARPADEGHASRSTGPTSRSSATTELTKLRRRHIGFVFQFFNLLPMLTAEENVALPLSLAGTKPDTAWFDEVIAAVGLADRRRHRPSELSGGQQQRVAIARALVSRPTVMFADEPTGNLDSTTSEEILDLMRASVDDYGQTTVMVTHEPRAATIADRILFLADGRIAKTLGRSTQAEVLAALEEVTRHDAGSRSKVSPPASSARR